MPLFDAEFQKRYEIHSYNEILMRTYTCPTRCVISSELEWQWNIQWHEASW